MKKKTGKNVIIRTQSAGVFAGELVELKGSEATLKNSRRLWYWAGAASLSQLAVEGTSKPDLCKFPVAMPDHTVLGVIEVIAMTTQAVKSIAAVPVWKQ